MGALAGRRGGHSRRRAGRRTGHPVAGRWCGAGGGAADRDRGRPHRHCRAGSARAHAVRVAGRVVAQWCGAVRRRARQRPHPRWPPSGRPLPMRWRWPASLPGSCRLSRTPPACSPSSRPAAARCCWCRPRPPSRNWPPVWQRGWQVTTISPYRSVPARVTAGQQLAALAADAVLFASGSAARAWVAVFGHTTPPVVVAIGPQTAAIERAGLKVAIVAADHSLPGLVAALQRHLSVSE